MLRFEGRRDAQSRSGRTGCPPPGLFAELAGAPAASAWAAGQRMYRTGDLVLHRPLSPRTAAHIQLSGRSSAAPYPDPARHHDIRGCAAMGRGVLRGNLRRPQEVAAKYDPDRAFVFAQAVPR
ncbi:hypothetical protein GCM10027200_04170 [Lentzea nigeriaca]